MYAITLCSHGYTFAGKGSRSDEVPTLVHKPVVYEGCHPLQGNPIPVCLGLLDLDGPCYLESPNPMTNLLLLSCGAIRLRPGLELTPPADVVISSAKRALEKLHDFNVTHHLCVENLLWSTEFAVCHNRRLRQVRPTGNPGVPPSARHRLSSSQNGHRRVVPNVKLSSSAGVQKGRKIRYRHGELKFLVGERRCKLPPLRWKFCGCYQNLPHEARRLPVGESFHIRSPSYCIRTCDPMCLPITSGHLDQIASLVLPW